MAHIDHLYKGFHYQNINQIKPVRGRKKDYLDQLVNSLYPETKKVEFYKIESTKPIFLFSPSGKIYFSKKLIRNYIDSEVLLKTLLIEILLRINFTVYQRTELSPTGYVNVQIIAALQRLPVVQRVNLDKWIFDHLKKNGLAGEGILDWIQIKNRNFKEFSYYHLDKSSALEEESLVKEFVLDQGFSDLKSEEGEKNKLFYYFKNEF